MCNSLNVEIALKLRKLFIFLKNYENYFDFKYAKIFFKYKNENHVTDFLSNAKLLYKPFYIFFEIKFKILKNYLLKNLILNYIRKSTSCASASIFFIFNRNNNFCFGINYKRLNVFIIKNKCSFSFIDETLNCLMNVVYFIKFNFKNVYY